MSEHTSYCDMHCEEPDCDLQMCRECGEDWPCVVTKLQGKLDAIADMCHETGKFNYWRDKPPRWKRPRELAVDILAVIKGADR